MLFFLTKSVFFLWFEESSLSSSRRSLSSSSPLDHIGLRMHASQRTICIQDICMYILSSSSIDQILILSSFSALFNVDLNYNISNRERKSKALASNVSSRFVSLQYCLPTNVIISIDIYTGHVFAPHKHEGVRQRYQLVSVARFVVAKNGMWYFQ